jgi:hypothetical protein
MYNNIQQPTLSTTTSFILWEGDDTDASKDAAKAASGA